MNKEEYMSEVNERWVRSHYNLQKQTAAAIVGAAALWLLSFYASIPAGFSSTAHEAWFGFSSIVTFGGALALTIGAGIGAFALLTDDPPMEGSNR